MKKILETTMQKQFYTDQLKDTILIEHFVHSNEDSVLHLEI